MLDSHLSGPQNIYQDFDGIAIFFLYEEKQLLSNKKHDTKKWTKGPKLQTNQYNQATP